MNGEECHEDQVAHFISEKVVVEASKLYKVQKERQSQYKRKEVATPIVQDFEASEILANDACCARFGQDAAPSLDFRIKFCIKNGLMIQIL